ncbi:ATP-binding protein [Desulfuribacillus alkaliarsenatis]|uniref:histidine kinase n=1 Tax=Desulfuribacillus alkaliarsenatis TaxID=766136 RepID=A0A1E5G0W1_9FIRM|nr:ATP-binding protein [Desulfuribacillus alkaliarsenatis]OEF96548.1 hypothetical protein BHF68_07825 [Desulfuribacillus alkaliarsenatis]
MGRTADEMKSKQELINELKLIKDENDAILESTRALMGSQDFQTTAKVIFNCCKKVIGNISGYVALLKADGEENEVIYLDSGGRPCTVDINLPMPIRGLREIAYHTNKAVIDNNFASSKWMQYMPAGHMSVDNVLFAPLVIDQKTVGLIGLANKKGGFTKRDSDFASRIGDIVALALRNTRMIDSLKQSISDLRLAEQKLRENDERLDAIVSQTQAIIYSCRVDDINPVITYVSPNVESVLGYKPDKFIGASIDEWIKCVHSEDKNKIVLSYNIGEIITIEYRVKHVNGEYRCLHDQFKVIKNENDEMKVIGALLDITDRKDAEEQQRIIDKLDSVGLLAGGIAHDFNNLLTVSKGNVALAKFTLEQLNGDYSRIVKYLEEAEKSFQQSERLTQQLLTFSKGGSPILKTTNSLKELLLDSCEFVLKGLNIKCRWDLEDNLHNVKIDEGQINQVINNIVINATQAMPDGGYITVKAQNITLEESEQFMPIEAGEYVKISITDQGCGMPDTILDKIFDPYFTTKANGNGLGLATSLSIIKKHGGYITVDSIIDKGTTFNIFLKATFSTNEMIRHQTQQKTCSFKTGKVIIMDDQVKVREVLLKSLEDLGFEVISARDGDEAVNIYEQFSSTVEFVFLDLTVQGGKGGKETIKELKKINPLVKAFVISGYCEDQVLSKYKEYGFVGAIKKPFNLKEIKHAIMSLH